MCPESFAKIQFHVYYYHEGVGNWKQRDTFKIDYAIFIFYNETSIPCKTTFPHKYQQEDTPTASFLKK